MKCNSHSHKDAVATCEVCKRGICKECADLVEEASGQKEPVCPKCYNEFMYKQLAYFQGQEKKTLIFLIVMAVCYLIGLLMILSGSDSVIFIGIVLVGLWWIPGGFRWMVNSGRAEVAMFGYEYSTEVDSWGKTTTYRKNPYGKYLILVVVLFIFGFITTPVLIIKNLFTWLNAKKQVKALEVGVITDQELEEVLQKIA